MVRTSCDAVQCSAASLPFAARTWIQPSSCVPIYILRPHIVRATTWAQRTRAKRKDCRLGWKNGGSMACKLDQDCGTSSTPASGRDASELGRRGRRRRHVHDRRSEMPRQTERGRPSANSQGQICPWTGRPGRSKATVCGSGSCTCSSSHRAANATDQLQLEHLSAPRQKTATAVSRRTTARAAVEPPSCQASNAIKAFHIIAAGPRGGLVSALFACSGGR